MKTKRRIYYLLSTMVILSMLALPACTAKPTATPPAATEANTTATPEETGPTAIPENVTMTDVGTPRAETLIVDMIAAPPSPDNFNYYADTLTGYYQGLYYFNMSALWEIDTKTGTQFPAMAAEPLKSLDDTYTKWQIILREGLYWSDGVEITAEDVAFTIHMVLTNPTLPYSGQLAMFLKDNAKVVDKYTVEVEAVSPNPRLEQSLGAFLCGTYFQIVPKHIWENVDVLTFENNPPVGSGPYVLNSYDPNGNWFLWARREDWERTDVGMIEGMPKPKYILYKSYGTEEKRLLAAIQNDLDIMYDISPESFEVLREKNSTAMAWYNFFPWADMDDPCERGIELNWAKSPYEKVEVRWALALATDIASVSQATYNGMLRVSPLGVPPTEVMQNAYQFPMEQWLTDFTLPDGYHPFDPDYAQKIATSLKQSGVEGIPEDAQEVKKIFGVGWWKYDVDEAAKLLESVGFTRNAAGKWLLPDGTPWTININGPANFEAESERLAYAVAESWNKFGVDTVVNAADAGTWWNNEVTGTFDAGAHWDGGCAVAPDVYTQMSYWHKDYVKPLGEAASANYPRVNSTEISAILDEMAPLSPDDPQITELTKDLLKQMITEMNWIPMFGTSKFVPETTYYWQGFPSADNFYNGPWWWWSCFKFILPHLEETGNK